MFTAVFALIFVFFSLSMSSADDLNSKDDTNRQNKPKNALAVVPYEQNNQSHHHPLERFHQEKWHFTFCGQNITIHQNWNNLGVAGVVWDAAVVLSEYLEKNVELVKEKKVVELGAGTGLVGIVAGLVGADITITDREEALKHLNDIVASNIPQEISHKVKVQALDWTDNLQKYAQPFEVILGADVIYIEETFQHLLKTLLHLSDGNTLVLLSCRIRYERDNNFLTLLKQHFTVTLIFKENKRDIRIYSAKRTS